MIEFCPKKKRPVSSQASTGTNFFASKPAKARASGFSGFRAKFFVFGLSTDHLFWPKIKLRLSCEPKFKSKNYKFSDQTGSMKITYNKGIWFRLFGYFSTSLLAWDLVWEKLGKKLKSNPQTENRWFCIL